MELREGQVRITFQLWRIFSRGEQTGIMPILFIVIIFLQCVVGRRRWKKGVDSIEVKVIATVTDKAFGLLLLENSWEKWVDMAK